MSYRNGLSQGARSDTAQPRTEPADGDVLVIEADAYDMRDVNDPCEYAVRGLGSIFQVLAGVTVILGLVIVAQMFGGVGNYVVVVWLEGIARQIFSGPQDTETRRLIVIVGLPVLLTVLGAWTFWGVGRGLRRYAPVARWLALAFLVPPSIPPLVLFVLAVQGRAYWIAAVALTIHLIPVSFGLLLAAPGTDRLFNPESRSYSRSHVRSSPRRRWVLSPGVFLAVKLAVILLSLMIVLSGLCLMS
ncbi:hypothetical protein V5E97_06190 [Singulisphaera sp. Ch08]|uniref:Yip1 domain-containing protein n=1 Tax=Singulisphaera sp. Ch08 TaxID=3120278 RepID=A0AAU7CKS4_9BACT